LYVVGLAQVIELTWHDTAVCISAIIIVIALTLAFKGSHVQRFFGELFKWFDKATGKIQKKHQSEANQDAKALQSADDKEQSTSSGDDSAMRYFGLGHRARRHEHGRRDVENPSVELNGTA
jgi:hypothetical protein